MEITPVKNLKQGLRFFWEQAEATLGLLRGEASLLGLRVWAALELCEKPKEPGGTPTSKGAESLLPSSQSRGQ